MEHPEVPTARAIMTRKLVTLRPEMPAPEAAEIMVRRSISGAPVVDESGQLVGLLSEYDCLQAVAAAEYEMDRHDAVETVGELMTPAESCHTVSPDLDLFGLAHEFVRLRVRRFPVVEDHRLLGQVSRRDALGAALKLRSELLKARRHYPDYPTGRDPIHAYPRKK
ncbi:MAG: CBS domain-containing protein [Myxococcota bacterium]|nr:CBS domain-containing protein [Myxococcota bacterium]